MTTLENPDRLTFTFATGDISQDNAVIEGVSVITEGPALGHGIMIDQLSLATVAECCRQHADGLKVKMDHGSGFDDIVGVLKNFRIDGNQLRADLQLLKAHECKDLILEMAATMPSEFGLSISFVGQLETVEDVDYMRCLEICSCDLVDEPAANPTGLFSKKELTPVKQSVSKPQMNVEPTEAEQIVSLSAERDSAREQAQKNFADLTTAKASLEAVTVERDEFCAKVTELSAEVEKLKSEAATAAEKAAQIVAANFGQAPIKTEADASADDKSKTRDEYAKLSPADALAFVKSGGKITD